jgi:putative DNA primase/helicase
VDNLSPEAFLDGVPPAFSEDALALRFADRHEGAVRFVAAWRQWFRYDGKVWRQDGTLHAYDLARRICREASAECNGKKGEKAALASAKTVSAIERLAKSDRRMAATIDQRDADPWLLNTPDGVINLRTGRMRAHRAEEYMTKVTAVGPTRACPTFLKFLDRITGEDVDLIPTVMRADRCGPSPAL